MKTDKQFVNTLEDIIRRRGAPTKLVSDSAQVEISNKVHDILRSLCIDDWQSEPYQQQQNPAERRYQTVKRITSTLMDRTGASADTWFLCMSYVCFVLNHTACKAINWQIPMRVLTGSTPDISPILRFSFYQPVYFAAIEPSFPSDSREERGRFVGIAEHVGHAMTFLILKDDTNKIIERSLVRPVDPEALNKRVDPSPDEESIGSGVKSETDNNDNTTSNDPVPELTVVDYSDLIGRSFLLDLENGERTRARIQEVVDSVEDHEHATQLAREHVKFKVSVGDKYDDIMTYDQIISKIEHELDGDVVWKFKRIVGHEGPFSSKHDNYKGSTYNVMVEWENGEISSEPLSIIAADDPVTCAIYARDNGLLKLPGWKRFKRLAARQKQLYRMANQAKLRSYNSAPKFKYGFEVPRDYRHAIWLDKRNGNSKWADATRLEMAQLDDYSTFKDVGKAVPDGYKKIRVHLVYDVKHDGRHKARLVADGHLTDIPLESVYSGVVSLRGIRLLTFISELNGLDLWATDIGNAYLEANTKEKVCILAGTHHPQGTVWASTYIGTQVV
jgi:Reverse transcriptase (RNA-dependent DNA polymerase)